MALPANPKIGDIITELQDLTLINQKAEMAGVVGAPTTSTSNNQYFVETIQDAKDIIATKTGQDNTLGLLEMAESLVVGKSFAAGIVTSNKANASITKFDGTNASLPNLTLDLRLIPFIPSRIIFTRSDGVSPIITVWNKENHQYGDYSSFSNCSYSSNSYRVPYVEGPITVPVQTLNVLYTWEAYQ